MTRLEARMLVGGWAVARYGLGGRVAAAGRLMGLGVLALTGLAGEAFAQPAVLQVGPERAIKTIAEAARRARAGDTVTIDAGEYRADPAVWSQAALTIKAVGGRARLVADGASAEGKAIWVIRGGRVSVEGFDFEGARVPARNGAGIRFEGGQLTVRDCGFFGNEMGLLTSNDRDAELTIENSEFAHNRRPDGHNHNLYAGTIARLTVRGSYFHHASVGHLLKSRAAANLVAYNRLTDETGGHASYELEFPNGGIAIVIGNTIEQSATSENLAIVSYGAEGYRWPTNQLALVHNTLVNDHAQEAVFLRVWPGELELKAMNNLLVGSGAALESAGPGEYGGNLTVARESVSESSDGTYRLASSTRALAERLMNVGSVAGMALAPTHEYRHPRQVVELPPLTPRRVGALHTPAS